MSAPITPSPADPESLIRSGAQAARNGNRDEARRLFKLALQRDPANETAWLWYASVADSLKERYEALGKVLTLNPKNARAREEYNRVVETMREEAAARAEQEAARDRVIVEEKPVRRPATTPPVLRPPLPKRRPTPSQSGAISGGRLMILVGVIIIGLAGLSALVLSRQSPQPNPLPTVAGQAATTPAFIVPTSNVTISFSDLQRTYDAATLQATRVGKLPALVPTRNAFFVPTWTPIPTATPPASATPTPTAIPLTALNLIFSGEGRGRGAIGLYTINAATLSESVLWKEGRRAFDAAYSPDGSQIAFITDEGDKEQVALMNADGSGARVVSKFTGKVVRGPSWSPSGNMLVVSSDQSGSDQLYTVSATSGAITPLTEGKVNRRDPAWSPDGTQIVFSADPSGRGSFQIFVMSANGQDPVQLTQSPNNNFSPAWSPDGTRIAFISTRERKANLFVMSRAGDDETILTIGDGSAENRDPAWSPDGRWIAFSSTRSGGSFQIFIIPSDGSISITQITKGADVSLKPRFAPTR